jgi:hypothetical protein
MHLYVYTFIYLFIRKTKDRLWLGVYVIYVCTLCYRKHFFTFNFCLLKVWFGDPKDN